MSGISWHENVKKELALGTLSPALAGSYALAGTLSPAIHDSFAAIRHG